LYRWFNAKCAAGLVKREVGIRGVGLSGMEWSFLCNNPLCLSIYSSHDDGRNQGEWQQTVGRLIILSSCRNLAIGMNKNRVLASTCVLHQPTSGKPLLTLYDLLLGNSRGILLGIPLETLGVCRTYYYLVEGFMTHFCYLFVLFCHL
jgi:hypothetical protein